MPTDKPTIPPVAHRPLPGPELRSRSDSEAPRAEAGEAGRPDEGGMLLEQLRTEKGRLLARFHRVQEELEGHFFAAQELAQAPRTAQPLPGAREALAAVHDQLLVRQRQVLAEREALADLRAQLTAEQEAAAAAQERRLEGLRKENLRLAKDLAALSRQMTRLTTDFEARLAATANSKAAQVGRAFMAACEHPLAVLKLPRRLWHIHRESSGRPPRNWFAKKRGKVPPVGELVAIHASGGLSRLQHWFEERNLTPGARERALLTLAKHCQQGHEPGQAALLGRAAYDLNPKPALAKWLAFRLFDAGHIKEALAFLEGPAAGAVLSDSETRRSIEVRVLAAMADQLPEVPPKASSPAYRPVGGSLLYVAASCLPYHTSGYTNRTHELNLALQEAGKVTVVTRPGYPWDRPDRQGVPDGLSTTYDGLGYLHIRTPTLSLALDAYFREAGHALAKVAREKKVAAIHSASNHINALPALLAARRLGLPFAYELRGLWDMTRASKIEGYEDSDRYRLGMQLEALVAREADRVFVISEALGQYIRDEWNVDSAKIELLPNCVNPETIERAQKMAGRKPDVFTVGYAGSLVEYEGLDQLIDALAEARKIGTVVHARIIGEGPERKSLEDRARSCGLAEQVQFMGSLPPDEARARLAETHAAVLPRKPDKVCQIIPPLKLAEAEGLGLEIIFSDLKILLAETAHSSRARSFAPSDGPSLTSCLLAAAETHQTGAPATPRRNMRNWSDFAEVVFSLAHPPTQRNPLVPRGLRPRVLALLGELSRQSFGEEIDLLPLSWTSWKQQIADGTFDFFLADSSSVAAGVARDYDLASAAPGQVATTMEEVLAALASAGKTTVLWHADSPECHERSKPIAGRFDHVFTTDRAGIDLYLKETGRSARELPFAANPELHHPLQDQPRNRRICFAGSWNGLGPPHQTAWLDEILQACMEREALDIFDRCSNVADSAHRFPQKFSSCVRGFVPEAKIASAAYRSCAGAISVHPSEQPGTGMARRIYELAACGTPVFSSPSAALEGEPETFVTTGRNRRDADDFLDLVLSEHLADQVRTMALVTRGVRFAHRANTYRHRVASVLGCMGRPVPDTSLPGVTAVIVSKRPHCLPRVIEMLRAQTFRPERVIFVCHSPLFQPGRVERAFEGIFDCRVLRLPAEGTFLADGLNLAREHVQTPLVAKIDDDDYYGPDYLRDSVLAFTYSDATVVGKNSHFCHMESSDQCLLRFPGRHFRPCRRVHGATLVWNHPATKDLAFARVRQGSDTHFLDSVRAAGGTIVSIDPFNFVHVRHRTATDHTWQIDDDAFAEKGRLYARGLPLADIMI